MTIFRQPGTYHDALHQMISELGDDAASAATGKSSGHLRQCSNPDEGREITLVDALNLAMAVARAGLAEPPLLTFLRLACRRATPAAAEAPPSSPHVVLMGCLAALGKLSSVLKAALEDGSVSPAEQRALMVSAEVVCQQADALRTVLGINPMADRIAALEADLARSDEARKQACADAAKAQADRHRRDRRRAAREAR